MTRADLAPLLAAWLPRQRWFAGTGAKVSRVAIATDVVLAGGEPEFRHLLADVTVGASTVRYQVPVGFRESLPPALGDAVIGPAGGGMTAYDAVRDAELSGILLREIAGQSRHGPLRFVAEPGADIDASAPGRTLPAEQSNTSIVFGESAILKVLRRPYPGRHPDVEVPGALARRGSRLVAAPLGRVETAAGAPGGVASDASGMQANGTIHADGAGPESAEEPTVLAILSRFYAGATSGWSLAMDSLRDGGPDFSPDARQLGECTGRLHAELAGAFGTSVLDGPARTAMAGQMTAELSRALAEVPGLAAHAAELRACYAAVAAIGGGVPVQRIHGDYHLAQVLRTEEGWIVLDFEGEPSVPLAKRRAYAPALRDVAGMLRSFDYAARHQLLGRPADDPLRARTLAWASQCQQEFCAGYAAAGPDPRGSQPLLRALILQKAVYEAVYEARHRPGWLSIPMSAIAAA